jgi:hypothetical protein
MLVDETIEVALDAFGRASLAALRVRAAVNAPVTRQDVRIVFSEAGDRRYEVAYEPDDF